MKTNNHNQNETEGIIVTDIKIFPFKDTGTSMDYHSTIIPVTREVRKYIENKFIKQYHKVVANG